MKKYMLIIGSISLILILSLTIFFVVKEKKSNDKIEITTIDIIYPNHIFVNEGFQLSVNDIPDDSTVTWDLGDGNTSEGRSISVTYDRSEYFLVTVNVTSSGFHGKGNTILAVFNQPVQVQDEGETISAIRPTVPRGFVYESPIYPGIVEPILNVDIYLENIVGTFQITISVADSPNHDGFYEDLNHIEYIERRKTIDYDEVFESLPIPEPGGEYLLEVSVYCEEGSCGRYIVDYELDY